MSLNSVEAACDTPSISCFVFVRDIIRKVPVKPAYKKFQHFEIDLIGNQSVDLICKNLFLVMDEFFCQSAICNTAFIRLALNVKFIETAFAFSKPVVSK